MDDKTTRCNDCEQSNCGNQTPNGMLTTCGQNETKTHNEQEDERVKGKGESRQSFKHIDGDIPMCMRGKDRYVELKPKKIERTSGAGGGRHRYRHVESNVPTCMRRKIEQNEVKSKENEKNRFMGSGKRS